MKEQVAEIVSAYLRRHQVAADQISTLISTVYGALSNLGRPTPTATEKQTPAVSVRRSVSDEAITCLDCGWKGSMIKRHLMTAHQLDAKQYREKWALPRDYPLVAKSYAARRSELAKAIGLGQKGRSRR